MGHVLGAAAHPQLARQRQKVREFRSRHLDLPMRQLAAARRALILGRADVVLMGDSCLLWGSPDDADPAMIETLLAKRLGARVVSLAGAGFNPKIYAEFLRILSTLDRRPAALVTSVNVRTATTVHVRRHPQFSYERSYAAMAQVGSARRPLPSWRASAQGGEAAYAQFEALPVNTRWGGESTIGEFRRTLAGHGPAPWRPDLEARLFDYFHGEEVGPHHPSLADCALFGHRVAQYNVPNVSFLAAVPTACGERHYPGEFAAHVHDNTKRVDAAIAEAAGPDWQLVDAGIADDEDFVNAHDGTEHFALPGRRKIVESVARALGY